MCLTLQLSCARNKGTWGGLWRSARGETCSAPGAILNASPRTRPPTPATKWTITAPWMENGRHLHRAADVSLIDK